ncbi:hypothetical protein [Noviluteimonas caseinilytica]|nr:hypothetical protein [Lysobacter caseinilyticus]
MMRKDWSVAGWVMAVAGLLLVVIFRQAWISAHRSGYPIFSVASWEHMKWWLLVAAVMLIGALVSMFADGGSE